MATFNNYATLSYRGLTAVSNLVTGEIVDGLQMTKTAVAEAYTPGDSITYAVSIQNAGTADVSGLTLSDDLGAYPFDARTLVPLSYEEGSLQYFVNGEIQTPPAVTAGPPLTIAEIAVPAGGNVMLLYAATANDYAPPCGEGQLTNTATLSGSALAEAITASAALSPNCEAELSITKAVEPAQVARNGELTYTFVITNLGTQAAEAADNVAVTDVFTPVLGGIAVTLNGTALDAAQYSYDTATGTFQTVPGVITVPAATFEQDADTGLWTGNPGAVTLTVTGTI